MADLTILHETKNLFAIKKGKQVEIRLNAGSIAFAIGIKPDLEAAKTTMARLEKYPHNLPLLIPQEERYRLSHLSK